MTTNFNTCMCSCLESHDLLFIFFRDSVLEQASIFMCMCSGARLCVHLNLF